MAVIRTEGTMPSCDGINTLKTVKWQDPDIPVKGIVQISHGMCEYVKRYDEMARFLAGKGFVVAGNDHLGHGESVKSEEDLGYIAEEDGFILIMEDLRAFTDRLHGEYPGVKLFLYGHSMGSFLARMYASVYEDGVDGYIFSGTAGRNPAAGIGKQLINFISMFKGERHRSAFISNMSFGSYCKRIQDAPTGKEWVTSDPAKLDEYVHDPHCMFTFTLSAYRDLMNVLTVVSGDDWAPALRKDVPYLLVAGREDPVGAYGAGPTEVSEKMKAAGCTDVELRLYDGIRHEPHNDVDRQRFFEQTEEWLEEKL